MLKYSLFKLISLQHQDNTIKAIMELNKNSDIFKGHFPDHPILPGACMLQMVKEVMGSAFQVPYRLKKADYLKFLKIIDPENNSILQLTISYRSIDSDNIHIIANLVADETICFKFQGSYII